MIIISRKWVQEAEPQIVHGIYPEHTFLKKASGVVKTMLEIDNDPKKAVKRLNYYINRGGRDVSNKDELVKALDILKKKASG